MIDELKAREEKRREAHWDSTVRWKVLQETITWAESQSTPRRNDPVQRMAEQSRKCAGTR